MSRRRPEITALRTIALDRGLDRGGHLDIDLGAIEANWRHLTRLCAPGEVAAVLKADAYGMGAAPIAARLRAAGCRTFFVATLAEARAIQPHALGATIAVLHGLATGLHEFVPEGAPVPVLNGLDELRRWAALGRTFGTLPAILHIDTGMSRLGFPPDEVSALAENPALLEGVEVLHVMSHLASSERADDAFNHVQRLRFEAACAMLPAAPRSLANSAGVFLGREFVTDLARPGAALLGLNPTPGRANPMRPAIRLRARVLQLRVIAAGDTVGYNATWRAARPSRIATVGIGYADGWLRAGSNRSIACFDGAAVPLVGRVSMDLSTYDVTDAPGLGVGDWLELIGPRCPMERAAEAAGTAGYEILTALGQRATRTHHG